MVLDLPRHRVRFHYTHIVFGAKTEPFEGENGERVRERKWVDVVQRGGAEGGEWGEACWGLCRSHVRVHES